MSGGSGHDRPATDPPAEEAPWYRRWFGEEYLELYPHRDEREAEQGVALLLDRVPLPSGSRVLDLACGAGRHLGPMRMSGLRAVGLDLSLPLLLRTRDTVADAPVVRGDMRALPFADAGFRAVTSFFTSFGYFQNEADDGTVLGEVRRVLEDGGRYLLDFLNAEKVRSTLSPRDEGSVAGRAVAIERRLLDGGRRVEKTIRISSESGGEGEVFRERVRLYEPEELESLLGDHGLVPEERFGTYTGDPFRDSSPRVIVLARAG